MDGASITVLTDDADGTFTITFTTDDTAAMSQMLNYDANTAIQML